MTAVLAIALIAPLLGVLVVAVTELEQGRAVATTTASVAAVAWTIVLLRGPHATASRIHPDGLGAATACGMLLVAAALVGRADFGRVGRCFVLAASGSAALLVNVADRAGALQPSALALGVAVPAGIVLAAEAAEWWWIAAGGVATGVLAAAAGTHHPPEPLAAVGLAGAVVLVGLTAVPDRPAARLLVPIALIGAARVSAAPATDGRAATALAIAVATAAVAAHGWRTARARVATVLGGMALAVLAADGIASARPAGLLLAAAAVLTAGAEHPAVAACALPGGAALVSALAASSDRSAVALAVALGVAVLAAMATAPPPARWIWSPVVPAAAVLLAAPGAWTWTGRARLDDWSAGVAVAVAAGLVAWVLVEGRRFHLSPTLARDDVTDTIAAQSLAQETPPSRAAPKVRVRRVQRRE